MVKLVAEKYAWGLTYLDSLNTSMYPVCMVVQKRGQCKYLESQGDKYIKVGPEERDGDNS